MMVFQKNNLTAAIEAIAAAGGSGLSCDVA